MLLISAYAKDHQRAKLRGLNKVPYCFCLKSASQLGSFPLLGPPTLPLSFSFPRDISQVPLYPTGLLA